MIAGSAVWLSFLLAGLVTGLLAYNVVKLGIRYPSEGGLPSTAPATARPPATEAWVSETSTERLKR